MEHETTITRDGWVCSCGIGARCASLDPTFREHSAAEHVADATRDLPADPFADLTP